MANDTSQARIAELKAKVRTTAEEAELQNLLRTEVPGGAYPGGRTYPQRADQNPNLTGNQGNNPTGNFSGNLAGNQSNQGNPNFAGTDPRNNPDPRNQDTRNRNLNRDPEFRTDGSYPETGRPNSDQDAVAAPSAEEISNRQKKLSELRGKPVLSKDEHREANLLDLQLAGVGPGVPVENQAERDARENRQNLEAAERDEVCARIQSMNDGGWHGLRELLRQHGYGSMFRPTRVDGRYGAGSYGTRDGSSGNVPGSRDGSRDGSYGAGSAGSYGSGNVPGTRDGSGNVTGDGRTRTDGRTDGYGSGNVTGRDGAGSGNVSGTGSGNVSGTGSGTGSGRDGTYGDGRTGPDGRTYNPNA